MHGEREGPHALVECLTKAIATPDVFVRREETRKKLLAVTQKIMAEAEILIGAGSDRTATSLTFTLSYLLGYPRTLSYALRRSIASPVRSRTFSCRFLSACIDEAMRLSPAVGAVVPGGLDIDGEYFAAGSTSASRPSTFITTRRTTRTLLPSDQSTSCPKRPEGVSSEEAIGRAYSVPSASAGQALRGNIWPIRR